MISSQEYIFEQAKKITQLSKALDMACADIEKLQDIITKLKLPDFEDHELYISDDCRPNLVKHYFNKAKEK